MRILISCLFALFILMVQVDAQTYKVEVEQYLKELKKKYNLSDDQVNVFRPIEMDYTSKALRLEKDQSQTMDPAAYREEYSRLQQESHQQLFNLLTPEQKKLYHAEVVADSTLRSLSTACEDYGTANAGNYPLSSAALTEASHYCDQTMDGFTYHCHFSANGYTFEAVPVSKETGLTTYTITTGGVLSP